MSSKLLSFFSRWVTPNQLTLLRIFVVPILYGLIFFYQEDHLILLATWVLYVFACLTDYWDGVLARYQNNTSRLGKLLDPVADKILLASLMIALVEVDRAPGALVTLILMRELSITGLRGGCSRRGKSHLSKLWREIKNFFPDVCRGISDDSLSNIVASLPRDWYHLTLVCHRCDSLDRLAILP